MKRITDGWKYISIYIIIYHLLLTVLYFVILINTSMIPFKERNRNNMSFQSFITIILAIGRKSSPALSLSLSLSLSHIYIYIIQYYSIRKFIHFNIILTLIICSIFQTEIEQIIFQFHGEIFTSDRKLKQQEIRFNH
jgi:hypothetical protein